MVTHSFTAVVHREGTWHVAKCPEVGSVSQGSTIDEAVANLAEATSLYLEEFPLEAYSRAFLTTFDVTLQARDGFNQ